MDFARQQLEKYGWKDGEGLGKSRNGISNPIKAALKFDNAGLGHKISDELVNPWWQRVYDSAAGNVNVVEENGTVGIKTSGKTEITTKRKRKQTKDGETAGYGSFVKRAALAEGGEAIIGSDTEEFEDEPDLKKRTSGICDLTDEELFKACGGRTAHKGARHGLSMSAKLERSARLEKEKLALLAVQIEKGTKEEIDQESYVKVSHKKKKKREKKEDYGAELENEPLQIETVDKKEKRKKSKRVVDEKEEDQLQENLTENPKKRKSLVVETTDFVDSITENSVEFVKRKKKNKGEEAPTEDFEVSTEDCEKSGKRKKKKNLAEETPAENLEESTENCEVSIKRKKKKKSKKDQE